MAPGIGVLTGCLLNMGAQSDPDTRDVAGFVIFILLFVLCAIGAGMGIAALTQIKTYGRKGILVPASLGVVLDVFLIVVLSAAVLRRFL